MDIDEKSRDEIKGTSAGRRDVGVQEYPTGAVVVDTGRKRVSWAAIFAGAAVAGVISLFLQLLGLGIGASTVHPQTEANPMAGLGIGSAIWTVAATLIAMFAGGWTAGRLSPAIRGTEGVLHGVVTWGFVTLVTAFLVTTAIGSVVGGTAGLLAQSAPAAVQQAQPQDMQRLQQQAGGAAQQLQQRGPEVAQKAAKALSVAGITGAIAIFLSGLSAALGGALGARGRRRAAGEPVEYASGAN